MKQLDGWWSRTSLRSMSASLPRHTARGTSCSPQTTHKRRTAPRRDPRCLQGAQARAEGWCRPQHATDAGGALAHGREQNKCFEQRRLKRMPIAQVKEFARHRNATPAWPAMSATQSTTLQITTAQPPPTIAKHSFENLRGSPAASGRTAA